MQNINLHEFNFIEVYIYFQSNLDRKFYEIYGRDMDQPTGASKQHRVTDRLDRSNGGLLLCRHGVIPLYRKVHTHTERGADLADQTGVFPADKEQKRMLAAHALQSVDDLQRRKLLLLAVRL